VPFVDFIDTCKLVCQYDHGHVVNHVSVIKLLEQGTFWLYCPMPGLRYQ
jgi:hypothetical protein